MAKPPGVLRITINDEDHPDNPELWTLADVERLKEIPADAPFVICRPLAFPLWCLDNKLGQCAGCGCGIQFRPENTIPVKICDDCSLTWVPNHARTS